MLDRSKTDIDTGFAIQKYLIEKGVETPMLNNIKNVDNQSRKKLIENSFNDIMKILGLNITDDSLSQTPKRVAHMYIDELFWGLDYSNFPKITTVDNKMNYNEMIIEKNISVMSVCEHHFVTIYGKACVAYIPKDKVLGLSKINRVVEFFSRRPQIQERLTEQIYYALSYILKTEDIAIIIEAEHFCVKSRGVEDLNSSTTTSKLGGCFFDKKLRNEFISLSKNI